MRTRIKPGLTYANVMATIAVFGMLAGGGAYAASKIGPNDIKKNAVRSEHIKGKQVASKHVKAKAIKPRHVKVKALKFRSPCPTSGYGRVVALGGLVVECNYGAEDFTVLARTTVDNAMIRRAAVSDFDLDFDTGETFVLIGAPQDSPVVYTSPRGNVVSLNLTTFDAADHPVVGTAVGG